jgi:hypothetical protein
MPHETIPKITESERAGREALAALSLMLVGSCPVMVDPAELGQGQKGERK